MNRERNLEIVNENGDQVQLNYGAEFGYFVSRLDENDIIEFCEIFNKRSWALEHLYRLTHNLAANTYNITLTLFSANISLPVYLLDHSVYIDATKEGWNKIDDTLFSLLQTEWRKFLSHNIRGYSEHFNNTRVLNAENATI